MPDGEEKRKGKNQLRGERPGMEQPCGDLDETLRGVEALSESASWPVEEEVKKGQVKDRPRRGAKNEKVLKNATEYRQC